jgi:hypothetical protein
MYKRSSTGSRSPVSSVLQILPHRRLSVLWEQSVSIFYDYRRRCKVFFIVHSFCSCFQHIAHISPTVPAPPSLIQYLCRELSLLIRRQPKLYIDCRLFIGAASIDRVIWRPKELDNEFRRNQRNKVKTILSWEKRGDVLTKNAAPFLSSCSFGDR